MEKSLGERVLIPGRPYRRYLITSKYGKNVGEVSRHVIVIHNRRVGVGRVAGVSARGGRGQALDSDSFGIAPATAAR